MKPNTPKPRQRGFSETFQIIHYKLRAYKSEFSGILKKKKKKQETKKEKLHAYKEVDLRIKVIQTTYLLKPANVRPRTRM